jgi:hypothetical protein
MLQLSQEGKHMKRIALTFTLSLLWIVLSGCDRVSTLQSNQQVAPEPFIIQSSIPADLDTSLSKTSDSDLFVVTASPQLDPIPLNEIHTWLVTITTREGDPVENATLTLEHLMPQHGHGMPTEPEFTGYLGGGQYRFEGMEFNMRGWWTLEFTIQTPAQIDTITFNLLLRR